jgi:putative addiction module component (TIGR02574 family)
MSIVQPKAVEPEISQAQKDELLRRRAEYLADPSIAEPWDEVSFDRFVQTLSDARARRASGSKV